MNATGECPKCWGRGSGDDDSGNVMPAICGFCAGTGKVTTVADFIEARREFDALPESVREHVRKALKVAAEIRG